MFTIKEAFKYGWEKMKENFWLLCEVFLITIIIAMIFSFFNNGRNYRFGLGNFLITIVSYMISVILSMGIISIALKIYNGQTAKIKDLFSAGKNFLNYIGASILYSLMVTIGLILLIVPGIILMIKFQFYSWFIVEKDFGPIRALKASYKMTKNQKGKLFGFWLSSVLISLAGVIILFVGILPALAITIMAHAFVYKKLSESQEREKIEAEAA